MSRMQMNQREGQDELPSRSSFFIPRQLRASTQMAWAQHVLTETEAAEFHTEGLFNIGEKRMHLFCECREVLQTASP